MKITEVRAAGLRGATPPGGWTDELVPEDVVHTLVAVHTDEGLVGVGSSSTSEDLVRGAIKVLDPLLIGENPLEPERVSEKLHRTTFWLGRGGSITHAISGIDLAMWDLLGKALEQPVSRLLGGRWRERATPYASILMSDLKEMVDTLTELKERGFKAFKIGWAPFGRIDTSVDEQLVSAAREAIGPSLNLMVDAGASDGYWSQGYKWAIRAAHMLADYDVAWFEEPLKPDALEDFVELRNNSPVPISGGEVLTRRQSFLPWLQRSAFDIVQPDVTKVGGLSEQRQIARLADLYGVAVVPHGWNTAIGLAADLHTVSALPDGELLEYRPGTAYIDDLVERSWELDADGKLAVPDAPGLGVTIRPDALERYTGSQALLA